MSRSPELKPCPFCGAAPAYDHTRRDGVRFSCLECEEATFEDFDQAADFWNRREGSKPVPGWRLVPEEPTEEMVEAHWRAHAAAPTVLASAEDVYRVMLFAAPLPPEGSKLLGDVEGGSAEALAQRFHEAYERLAPTFGYETRRESAKPWADVPEQNRHLMTAVCAEILALFSGVGGEAGPTPQEGEA